MVSKTLAKARVLISMALVKTKALSSKALAKARALISMALVKTRALSGMPACVGLLGSRTVNSKVGVQACAARVPRPCMGLVPTHDPCMHAVCAHSPCVPAAHAH